MLNEFRSTSITWDKATRRIYSPITANASDENGRKLVVQIVNGGQVEDLTGSALHLYWETRDKVHDGLDVFDAVDLKKGEFELSYTTGMLSNQGVLNANFVLIDTVGRVVSERFKITVTEGIDNDAIQSENSFSSLTQALIDVSNLEQNYAPRLNDLTAQLQQKVDEGQVKVSDINKNYGLIDETYLSDTLKAQMAGTTAIGSTPPDESITPKKTTFFNTGKNLFNKDTAVFGYRVNELNGELSALNDFYASDFIIVEPNTEYTERSGYRLAFYDEQKAFISGLGNSADPSQPRTFTTPTNTKYIRVSTFKQYLSDYQLEKGNVKTSFSPFRQYIQKELLEDKPFNVESVPPNTLKFYHTNFIETGKNLFDKTAAISNYMVSNLTGALGANSAYSTSDYIPVKPNTDYVENRGYYMAFYDSSKVFISGLGNAPDVYISRTFKTPSNAYFVRLSIANSLIDTFQFELGTISTQFESYRHVLSKGQSSQVDTNSLENNIKGTKQSITFNTDGTVLSVEHKDSITDELVREDVFSYAGDVITEIRSLADGSSLTLKHNLYTFETEVI